MTVTDLLAIPAAICLQGVALTHDLPAWLAPVGLLATMLATGVVSWFGVMLLSIAID